MAAFEQLDSNSDGYLSVSEIQERIELDDDEDGEVSDLRGEGEVHMLFVVGITGRSNGVSQ